MRIGVYVCHCGGNISEVVDVKRLVDFAKTQPDVVHARDVEHMCSELGQSYIVEDIKEHNLDRVVVAACSPLFHEETFREVVEKAGLNRYTFVMANIREHCAWCHFSSEDTNRKAEDILRAAISKVRLTEPLERKSYPIGKRVLVIGGGIAGIQAALDLGDSGFEVHLVERYPTIGGRMARLSKTFPTEDCAVCILSPKMAAVPKNPNIKLYDYSEVESIKGSIGNFEVTVVRKPRYVDPDKCTACGTCSEKCPGSAPNEFNYGLDKRKAIYIPCDFAVPRTYVIDPDACLYFKTGGKCGVCQKVCPEGAIDFTQQPKRETFTVDTIIVATGFDVFDATQMKQFGFGKYSNVITAPQLERIIAAAGSGVILKALGKRIAFVQCVGSRDEQVGNNYCSRICCMFATKLARLLKRTDPTREIYIFYIDLRAYGKGFEEYYRLAQESGIKYIRGKVAQIIEDPETKKVTVIAEDTLNRQIIKAEFDQVVLSTGIVPSPTTTKIAEMLGLATSPDGFLQEAHPKFRPVDTLIDGVFLAGCCQGPKDIPDTVAQASAAASRAIRLMNKGQFEVEPTIAFVHKELCDGCGLCVDACPLNAISIEDGVAVINELVCKGCGQCLSACPTEALDINYFTHEQLRAEIDAAVAGKKKPKDVRLIVFADNVCTYRLADNVGTAKMSYANETRIIRVPSGSRVTPKLILYALSAGADGVFIGECDRKGNPFPGAVDAIERNVEQVRKILEAEGIEPDRVRYAEFITPMLSDFTQSVNFMTRYLKREVEPISEEKRKKLWENVDEKLFGEKVAGA